MIRDLLLPLQYSDTDASAADAAATLATAHAARVAVLATVTLPLPMVSEWGLVALPPDAADAGARRQRAREAGDAVRARIEAAGAACELRLPESLAAPEEVAALHGRHADLCVIGGPAGGARLSRFDAGFLSLLTQTGRPVLMVPVGARLTAPPRRAVLAWQPRREAARAAHDALSLLPAGARVDVLMVEPVPGELQHGEQPGADIAAHLARHGLEVRVVSLPREGHDVASVLTGYARREAADLLVMGGYGHSRFREMMLGGVTRHMLEHAPVPMLLAH
jgi:nucleotide-binding universal stress UspA family protein